VISGLLWLMLLLIVSSAASKASAGSGSDNGSSIGTWFQYSGSGMDEFTTDFYNTGFSSSGSSALFWVVTASLPVSGSDWLSQISIQENPNGSSCLSDSLWSSLATNDSTKELLVCNSASNLEGQWNTLELYITWNSQYSAYFINWYLDGTWYNSWDIGSSTSSFDNAMSPSFSFETTDTTNSDFSSVQAHGYLMANGVANTNEVHPYFYGGLWGNNENTLSRCATGQSSGYYIGGSPTEEAATNVGVTGYIWDNYGASNEFGAGGALGSYSPITDPQLATLLSEGINACYEEMG
jgi:hypothetical protein